MAVAMAVAARVARAVRDIRWSRTVARATARAAEARAAAVREVVVREAVGREAVAMVVESREVEA